MVWSWIFIFETTFILDLRLNRKSRIFDKVDWWRNPSCVLDIWIFLPISFLNWNTAKLCKKTCYCYWWTKFRIQNLWWHSRKRCERKAWRWMLHFWNVSRRSLMESQYSSNRRLYTQTALHRTPYALVTPKTKQSNP